MIRPEKIRRFVSQIQLLIKTLDSNQELVLHREIDQFYYMQKREELKVLLEKFDDVETRMKTLSELIDSCYSEVFCEWRKDVRKAGNFIRLEMKNPQ
jgi:hypothetical protein